MSSNLLKLLPLLALSACGFTPLYGGDSGTATSTRLDEVEVQNIPERPGQLLRESLQTALYPQGAPAIETYALNVTYNVVQSDIGILADTAGSRVRYTGVAVWSLSPIGNPAKVLAHGTATAMDAEDTIDEQYFAGNLQANTINQHLADELAGNISSQLAVWFSAHPGA